MAKPFYFYILSLGCKINQYESQQLRQAWSALGGLETDDPAKADQALINSCAVTAAALADLRTLTRRLHRLNPSLAVTITGCAAEACCSELATLPGVSRIMPQSGKFELIGSFTGEGRDFRTSVSTPASNLSRQPPITNYPRSRPVVKIQDGCSRQCSYCIVPLARGPSRSRGFDDILAEIRGFFRQGFGEVVLSGVNLSQFGRDLHPSADFWDLVAFLDASLASSLAGQARLRISSLDPSQLESKALGILSEAFMVCPHLHLSLQSASPAVLKRMRRFHYHMDSLYEALSKLSEIWPVFSLGADILVGFPGESEVDFLKTLDACQRLPLSYVHVFPYSKRPGTLAADMTGQISRADKSARSKAVRDLVQAKKQSFLRGLTGLDCVNVVMSAGDSTWGMTEYYVRCRFAKPFNASGAQAVVPARPVGTEGEALVVKAI